MIYQICDFMMSIITWAGWPRLLKFLKNPKKIELSQMILENPNFFQFFQKSPKIPKLFYTIERFSFLWIQLRCYSNVLHHISDTLD